MNKPILFLSGAVGAYVVCGLPYHIDTTTSQIETNKIKGTVKIAVIADLHCRRYGTKQSRIMQIIEKEGPDMIIIPGDLFDVDRDYEISFELIEQLQKYPVFFTSGNHDTYLRKDIADLRTRLKEMGVEVLENQEKVITVHDNPIELYGLSDHGRRPNVTSEEVSAHFQTDAYRILISHRPEFASFYGSIDTDMIISGHAHGGQWRIPGTHQGLYAPHAGLLPKYTEGVHDLNGKKLVISRGLASGDPMIPRLYNNPEIVMIHLHGTAAK